MTIIDVNNLICPACLLPHWTHNEHDRKFCEAKSRRVAVLQGLREDVPQIRHEEDDLEETSLSSSNVPQDDEVCDDGRGDVLD